MIEIFTYDTKVYPFRAWAQSILGCNDLEHIHEHPFELAKNPRQRVYYFTKMMKDAFQGSIRQSFAQFVETMVAPRIEFEPWLEIYPNFRVHEADQEATSPMHRDRDYVKEKGSLKIWLPFTHVSKGGTLWIESHEGKGDLRPYEMEYGQALLFDSLNLLHGCYFNDSGTSRVSMDFMIRLNPKLLRYRSLEEKETAQ